MTRLDNRANNAIREVSIETRLQKFPEGSALCRFGATRVLIAASVDDNVPEWLKGRGQGWITAEYAMHPRANPKRQSRDGRKGRIDGRTQEIQRLIGRSLRAAVDMEKLGERSITIDCDVLDADGGTRTAAITGGFVALAMGLGRLQARGVLPPGVLRAQVAAVSAGLVDGTPMLDLCYEEDHAAEVDLNVVATPLDEVVEIQGTSEGKPVPRGRFDELIALAMGGMKDLCKVQRDTLAKEDISLDALLGS